MSNKVFTIKFYYVIFFYVVLAVNIRQKEKKIMLMTKNQEEVFKILSCIFAVILIMFVVVSGNIIDYIYLGIVSLFILNYYVEIRKK